VEPISGVDDALTVGIVAAIACGDQFLV